jgi:hypothetical protein
MLLMVSLHFLSLSLPWLDFILRQSVEMTRSCCSVTYRFTETVLTAGLFAKKEQYTLVEVMGIKIPLEMMLRPFC